jgi:hypothetical protein
MTLVFVFTLCYTGLGAELGYPCAQVMTRIDEPRQNQKTNSYQQKQVAIHGIPLGYFGERLSNRKYIMRIHVMFFIFQQFQGTAPVI